MSIRTGFRQVLWIAAILFVAGMPAIMIVSSQLLALLFMGLFIVFVFVLIWGQNLTRQRLIITLLAFSILLPDIPIPNLWDIRPEEILTLALLPIILTQISWRWSRFDIFFALIGISTVLSMVWGTLLGVPFSPRDVMELVKIAKYWLFFHLAFCPWSERDIGIVSNTMLVCMTGAAFVGIWQWQNWLGIGRWLQLIYGYGLSHAEKGRIVGTMANPNDYALLLATGLAMVMGAFKDVSRKRQFLLLLSSGLLAVGIAIIGSRTGVVGVVIVFAVGVGLRIIKSRSVRQRFRWLGIVAIALLLAASVVIPWGAKEFRKLEVMSPIQVLDYVDQGPLYRLVYRFSIATAEDGGIAMRQAIWQSHLDAFWASPLLGWGPGKSTYSAIVDSEYVFYLRRYGIIGLSLLLLLYGQIFRFCWKLLRSRSVVAWRIGAFLIATLLVYLAANFVLYTFYILQLMSVFWLMVGMGYSMVYFPNTDSCPRQANLVHLSNIPRRARRSADGETSRWGGGLVSPKRRGLSK